MRRPAPLLLTAATAAGLAFTAPPATAAPPDVEQVNRATGVAGAFGLTNGRVPTKIGPVSDDGRYVFFGVGGDFPGANTDLLRDAIPGQGLWARDIVRNTTTKLTGDSTALFTGMDRTSHLVSFVTAEPLAGAADTNGAPDLYAYEPLTGLKVLISRRGAAGKAVGLTSYGTITRGSTVAIYGTAEGVIRRELLSGRTSKLGDGDFLAPLPAIGEYPVVVQLTDQFVSNDGRVYVSSTRVEAGAKSRPLPGAEEENPVLPFVNEAGTRLTWQPKGSLDLGAVRAFNLQTGVGASPAVPAALEGKYGMVQRATPDGGGVLAAVIEVSPTGNYTQDTRRWTFATGQVKGLGPLLFQSRNEKYGVTVARSGAYVVGGSPGVKLPGTVDLPSAVSYVSFGDRCEYDPEASGLRRKLEVYPERNAELPVAKTVRFRASAGAGKPVVVDRTIDVPTQDGFDPDKLVDLPFADGAFRLDLTVTLADGRTITSRVDHAARQAPDGC